MTNKVREMLTCRNGSIPAVETEECTKPAVAARMPQFAKSLGFNLAYTLVCYGKALADFFKGVFGAVFQAKAHSDNPLLARSECIQYLGCSFR